MMAGNVKLLQRWLVLVALARLLSVYLGLLDVNKFKIALIDRQPDLVTPIFGRLFAAWTTVTSILCLICAYDPTDRPIYIATMASFIVALVFFLSEMFIYETVGVKGGTSPLIVASVSAIWMLLGMNYYTRDAVRQPMEYGKTRDPGLVVYYMAAMFALPVLLILVPVLTTPRAPFP